MPPPDHDKKPWETSNDLMDDDADMRAAPLGEVGQSSLKMAIVPEPIKESEEEQRQALERMKSTLAAPGAAPQRRGTIARCVPPPPPSPALLPSLCRTPWS